MGWLHHSWLGNSRLGPAPVHPCILKCWCWVFTCLTVVERTLKKQKAPFWGRTKADNLSVVLNANQRTEVLKMFKRLSKRFLPFKLQWWVMATFLLNGPHLHSTFLPSRKKLFTFYARDWPPNWKQPVVRCLAEQTTLVSGLEIWDVLFTTAL